jgi:hypothetical protein
MRFSCQQTNTLNYHHFNFSATPAQILLLNYQNINNLPGGTSWEYLPALET